MSYEKWILIFSSTLLFILSDSLSANWGKTGSKFSIIVMFFIAPLGYLCFGLLNKNVSLAVSSGIVNMMLLIGTAMVGIFYFKDDLSAKQMIGLLLAVVAIFLMRNK